MKTKFYLIALGFLIFSCTPKNDNWTILFDGSNLDSWKGYLQETPSDEWAISDNTLVFTPANNRGSERNNIITKESFNSFVLHLEWKISSGGNSGVFWAIDEDEKYGEPYETGPEIQVLDNEKHPDGKIPSHRAGSLYDMIQALPESAKPIGEWNSFDITIDYKNNVGLVVLNNVVVVEFPVKGEEWNNMVVNSKFASWSGFAKTETGKIGLQDHNDQVFYRNIKIKRLP
jgi:hypothetical protein